MRFKTFSLFAVAAFALTPATVQAAPQILGLMASRAPVPMMCMNGTCTAELSTVCLQEHRPTPETGTVYLPAKGTQITLIVAGPHGAKQQRIEGALNFTSLRQYHAIKVSLPEAAVRQLGYGSAMLSVGPMASLIPVAAPGDPSPLSDSEIGRYTGPMRAAAARSFDRDRDRVGATDVLNRMVNRLSANSSAGFEEVGRLWKHDVTGDTSAGTRKIVSRAFEHCREAVRVGLQASLRSCLAYQHDYYANENTTGAWQAMEPGI
ncbi:MAG: hypothetical protein AB7O50_07365 [Pseudolabrys sp.]